MGANLYTNLNWRVLAANFLWARIEVVQKIEISGENLRYLKTNCFRKCLVLRVLWSKFERLSLSIISTLLWDQANLTRNLAHSFLCRFNFGQPYLWEIYYLVQRKRENRNVTETIPRFIPETVYYCSYTGNSAVGVWRTYYRAREANGVDSSVPFSLSDELEVP